MEVTVEVQVEVVLEVEVTSWRSSVSWEVLQ